MLKKDFIEILTEEVEFYGKRFIGETDKEKEEALKRFLLRYYESLSHASESSLLSAFKKCRESYEYFPKISQLLKFCPPPQAVEENYQPKYVEPSLEVKKALASIAGTSKTKVGEKQLRENASLCARRWPGSNWDEPLERWIKEDGFRK